MKQEPIARVSTGLGREGRIICVVGARPNYMKIAPIMRAFESSTRFERPLLVHTGQHYDVEMNDKLFSDLELPAPEINLEVGSGSHAVQTAEVMRRFEPLIDDVKPAAVLVVGDVNSTLACALVAAKRHVPVVHVEAGLRSFDRKMPEEINRVLTDQISDLLFTTERSAHDNLAREGIEMSRVRFVGNVMIDSLFLHRTRAPSVEEVVSQAGDRARSFARESGRGFGLVTLHRPANVDDVKSLSEAVGILRDVSKKLPLVWPIHPRTKANIGRFGLSGLLDSPEIIVLPPQGYLQMVALMSAATVVLTDSGGVQEETTALSVPCLTMRDSTERPITVEQGTNEVVGRDHAKVLSLVEDVMRTGGKRGRVPELWDGHAGERIVAELGAWIQHRQVAAEAAR